MSYPSVPKDPGSIPISSIYIPGTGWVALQGTNSSIDGSGNPSAGVVAALYGKVTNPGDTPLLLDSSGRVLIGNTNSNGQGTMLTSSPVAIASDQSPVPIKRKAVALFTTAQVTVGTGDSGDLAVDLYTEISIDITTSARAGTNPTIQFFWYRKGADTIYYPIWQSDVLTLASNTCSTSIGAGMAYNQSLGSTGKLGWTVGGTATPTWSFTPNVTGK